MIITYFGKQFFKVQFGTTTVAFDPIGKDSKLKGARFGVDIAIVSLNHPDFNGIESVTYGEKKPFAITGPGEYEIGGTVVRGFQTQSQYGKEPRLNTVYLLELEGMHLCFLGHLHGTELSEKTREALEEVDILFVPVGGEALSPAEAYKMATKMEASIVIPMPADEKALKDFLKESGKNPKSEDKLTIKKKDLEGKKSEVVVLSPQS